MNSGPLSTRRDSGSPKSQSSLAISGRVGSVIRRSRRWDTSASAMIDAVNVDRRQCRLRPFHLLERRSPGHTARLGASLRVGCHPRSLMPSVAASVMLAACGKATAPSDAGATVAAPPPSVNVGVRESPLPHCEPWIVTELAVPKDWKTYPIVATSGPEVTTESRSFDHYVDELVDVSIGPFLLRYWQGRTRPTTDGLALRLAGCRNPPLQITALSYWNGGPVILRMKESVFTISSAGSFEQLIAVVRRLPK